MADRPHLRSLSDRVGILPEYHDITSCRHFAPHGNLVNKYFVSLSESRFHTASPDLIYIKHKDAEKYETGQGNEKGFEPFTNLFSLLCGVLLSRGVSDLLRRFR